MLLRISTFFLLTCLILLPATLFSQVLEADVQLRADRLQPEDQQILRELPQRLQNYINSYTYAERNRNILIKVRINFIIESATRRGGEGFFRGQFLINSPAGENFVDRTFQFLYQEGQSFNHSRNLFDSLLDLVDYYIYMVIAGELDTYFLKGGSFYYDIARNLADQGLTSEVSTGWRSRLDEVNRITDADHGPLREAKFYFYEGFFYHEVRNDAARVPIYARRVVELLEKTQVRKPNSITLKRFMDAHYQEFCELFSYDTNRENADKMVRIDNRHSEAYQRCEPAQ